MTMRSNRSADRTNRIVLTIIGSLLIAGTAFGLVVSVREPTASQTLVNADQAAWINENATALAIGALAAAVLIVVLLAAWLIYQLRPVPQAHDLIATRRGDGATVVSTSARTDVIEAEIIELPGVADASARIRASDPSTVDILLDVDDRVELPRLVDETSGHVLARARQATGRSDLELDIECRPVSTSVSRVT
jgi:hypothetical protein